MLDTVIKGMRIVFHFAREMMLKVSWKNYFVISHFLMQKGNRGREQISQCTTKQFNSALYARFVVEKRYHISHIEF